LSGVTPRSVSADSPGIPNPYRAEAIDSQTARVLWINTASEGGGNDVHFNLRYRLQSSERDVYSSYTYIGGGGLPDDLQLNVGDPNDPTNPDYLQIPYRAGGSYDVTGLSASTSYCFSLRSFTYYVDLLTSPDANIPPTFSPWSGEVCATTLAAKPTATPVPSTVAGTSVRPHVTAEVPLPYASTHINGTVAVTGVMGTPTPATKPDLDAVSIAGPATVSSDINQVYTATIRNDGAAANGNVEVVIGMSGALQAWDTPSQTIGLSCTLGSGSGANTYSCEGGTLAAGQTATIQFRVHPASSGPGTIVLSLNPSRSLDESDYGNNLQVLNVTVK
jgi:hypothetical protein